MEKQQQGRAVETTVTTTTIYDNEERQEQPSLRSALNAAFEVSFILLCGVTMFLMVRAASKKPKPEEVREA